MCIRIYLNDWVGFFFLYLRTIHFSRHHSTTSLPSTIVCSLTTIVRSFSVHPVILLMRNLKIFPHLVAHLDPLSPSTLCPPTPPAPSTFTRSSSICLYLFISCSTLLSAWLFSIQPHLSRCWLKMICQSFSGWRSHSQSECAAAWCWQFGALNQVRVKVGFACQW